MSKGSKKRLFDDLLDRNVANDTNESIMQANLHAKTKTFTESITHAVLLKENEALQIANDEVNKEAEKELLHDDDSKTIAKDIVESEAKSNVKLKIQSKKQSDSEMIADPASILLNRIGTKKERVEDQRIRRTYWLSKEEIKMVDDLAKITGMDKYEVVSVAVQSMYSRAMEKKGK